MATALSGKRGRRHGGCEVCGKVHAPWFASSKKRWMLSVGVSQINLGPDHDEALIKWHRIESGIEPAKPTVSALSGTGDEIIIGELVAEFYKSLDQTSRRWANTQRFLGKFVLAFGAYPVANLRVGGPTRIEAWLKTQTTWVGCRPDVIARIRQLFNWATDNGYIPSSPVKALKKPKYNKRLDYFSAAQVDAILAHSNQHFRRGFKMLVLTGCRPDEICSLTAADVREDARGLYLYVKHKNIKKTGAPRRVFLVSEAEAIVKEALAKYPTGRLFRSNNKTADGIRPDLSPEYFNKALRDLCEKPELVRLGLNDFAKVGGKRQFRFVPYTARHTFAVRYLTGFYKDASGKPIILNYGEVASLLGNSAKMVEEIYGHLVDQTEFLNDRLAGKM